MLLNRLPTLMNDEPGAAGGGGDAGAGASPSPAPAPEPTGLETEAGMASAVDTIADGLGLDLKEDTLAGAGDPPAASPAPAAPAASPAPTSGPAPAGKFTAAAAPTTWTAAAQAKWQAIDPEIRAEIAKRENDMFSGLEGYRADANFARAMRQLTAPVAAELSRHGVGPEVLLTNLTQAHVMLSSPQYSVQQKTQMAANWLKNYGIDLAASAAAPAVPGDAAYVDPQVAGLQSEIQELKSRLDGADARTVNQTKSQILGEIELFAKDPANMHFDEVADDIVTLIRGSGGKMPLKEAYDKAVFANPVTRAKEFARLQSEAAAAAKKEQDTRAAAAKRAAGANVNTSGHRGGVTAAKGSMDDTMAATLRDIHAREAS